MSGIAGCFMELLDDVFNGWFEETYKFRITYKDGLVFMLEKNIEETQ